MPKVSRDSVELREGDPVEYWQGEFAGYEISFVGFRETVDAAPLLRGLPDDRCQCPHWGYVMKGRLTFRFADHVETFEAGDVFYVPAGHTPSADEGTEYVQFSPADEIKVTNTAIEENLEKLGSDLRV